MKRYNIVYIDPPWTYKDKALSGNRGAGCKYPLMSINDIKNLSVGGVSDKDCVLFMWVTMPKLNECFEVIKSWGFEYKTVAFVWIKKNKKSDSLFMGMGRWTRANGEICLLATKGKPKRISASVHSVLVSPIEGHSKKPDEIRKRIVDLVGDLPRIEIFGRQKVEGWDVIGNDIDGKDIKESLNEIITGSNSWQK